MLSTRTLSILGLVMGSLAIGACGGTTAEPAQAAQVAPEPKPEPAPPPSPTPRPTPGPKDTGDPPPERPPSR
jgi:hypothetical protein